MRWPFGKKTQPDPEGSGSGHELLDPDHHRASVVDEGQVTIAPAKVRSNVALAIERVDLDVDTAISLEDDVVRLDELAAMVRMRFGPLLITDVVNTAVRVMLARYPEDLVRRPFPPHYDLRVILPGIQCTDVEHARAVAIANRRMTRDGDLDPYPDDPASGIDDLLDGLDDTAQVQTFVLVFFASMTKIGALKNATSTD